MKVNRLNCFGKHIKAKRLLEEILEEEPGHSRAHYELALIYHFQLFDFNSAELHYKFAIRFEPGFAFPYYVYQKLLFQESRFEDLIAFSKTALGIRNIYKTEIYKYMGLICEESKKLNKANKYYEKAISYAINIADSEVIKKMIERVKEKLKKGDAKKQNKKKQVVK